MVETQQLAPSAPQPAVNSTLSLSCAFPTMNFWERGFDRYRFCRDNPLTYRTPTCCNLVQDRQTGDASAGWIPKDCLPDDSLISGDEAIFSGYKDFVGAALCAPCAIGSQADLGYVRTQAGKTTFYICEDYAKQVYSPGVDKNDLDAMAKVDLSAPTKGFNSCGWMNGGPNGQMSDYFPYKNALEWFNSNDFKSPAMQAMPDFHIVIVDPMYERTQMCFRVYDESAAQSLMATAVAIIVAIACW